MPLVDVKDIHTYYGQSCVLHGISLSVEAGVVHAVIGRNGMGKTTLMRSLVGLTPPRSGTISFDDRQIESLDPSQIWKLGIGYVPQGRLLFPRLSVQDNLRTGQRNRRERRPKSFDTVYEVFPRLYERRRQFAGSLSGGEQQQLAVGRALVSEPRLLLLDEPTEGVQPSIVMEIFRHLTGLNRETGLTIVLVEQNMEVVLEVAHRYTVFEGGRVVEDGAIPDMDVASVIDRFMVV